MGMQVHTGSQMDLQGLTGSGNVHPTKQEKLSFLLPLH